MNVGGLATVQPIQQNSSIQQQQTTTPEQVKIMTCDGDTMSAASLELRSRFTGSIEKMKIISERAKKRQENARPAIIKREREDQQKYHRRYMELAMKQHAEQQAKTREMNNTNISSIHHNPSHINLLTSHNTPYNHHFASAPGTSSSYIPATPTSTLTRQANNRKRQYDHMQNWASSQMCSPIAAAPIPHSTTQNNNSMSTPNIQQSYNMSHCPPKLLSPNDIIAQQQQLKNIAFPDSTYTNLASCQNMDIMNVSSSTSSNNSSTSLQMLNADNIAHSNSNSNANISGNSNMSNNSTNNTDMKPSPHLKTSTHLSLSSTTITSPNHNTSSDNLRNDNNTVNNNLNHNQTVLPELADSQMKNLIDQFEAGNPLNDLGDGCLEDVLSADTDQDTDQQSSTSTQHVVLPSNNITPSPINHSLTSVNSNSVVSPTSLTGVTGTTTPTSMVPNTPTGIIPNTPTGMISNTPTGMLSNPSSMPSQPLSSAVHLSKVVNSIRNTPSHHHSSSSSIHNNGISNGTMIMATSATPTDSQSRSQQQQQQSYSIASTCSNNNNNNPLGVPLGSSTPSTSAPNLSSVSTSRAAASSCCFSQLQSTSSFAPSHPPSVQQQHQTRSRVPYPTGITAVSHSQDALLRHQQQQQQQQHQMMMQQTLTNTSNHHLSQLQPQQPYIYPSCMNGTSSIQQQQQQQQQQQEMSESNALLQMRQSVDELSTNMEKRSRFAQRFAPCASDYSNIDTNSSNVAVKNEMFPEQQQQQQSFIANNRLVPYPTNLNANRPMPHPQQLPTMSQPQQLFNPYHQAARQRTNLENTSTPEYSYQMRMNQAMNQQMAMYPVNGQMTPHQQFTQQYYPSRNVYNNYRYC